MSRHMPTGWKGVQRAADEWVRWALFDATGRSSASAIAEQLIAVATLHGISVEDLVVWIHTTDDPSTDHWARVARDASTLRREPAG